MTHTTQRRGLDPSRPGEEIVMLAMVSRKHRAIKGIGTALTELAAKMLEYGRDQWPQWTIDRFEAAARGATPTTLAAAFTDVKKVEALLRDLRGDWLARNKKKGYPISIVLSGLVGDTHRCCRNAGLTEHTHLHSLGFFGRVQDLPLDDELALVTMCGHGLIAAGRIRHLVRTIKDGELTPEEAADDIALPCVCGIGNKKRAEEIFTRLAGKE